MLNRSGFALPTVLIASLTMFIVLLATLTAATSVSTAIQNQYDLKLAKEAAESGVAMAKACLERTTTPTWSDSSPLHPNTDCSGGYACTNSDACYVLSGSNIKTTFSVGNVTINSDRTYTMNVNATVQLLRSSGGQVWKTYTNKSNFKARVGWKQLAPGTSYSCGITLSDGVYCWGYGGSYGIGNGITNSAQVPYPQHIAQGEIPSGVTLKSVVSNTSYGGHCALGSDGKAYCWGRNTYGQLGNNSTTDANFPVAVVQGAVPASVKFTSVSIGYTHACGLGTDSKVYCWGYNGNGQLGNNSTTDSHVPVAVSQGAIPSGIDIKSISLGFRSSCAIGTNDRAYCWGYNGNGQLGVGNAAPSGTSTPMAVLPGAMPSGVSWKSLSMGLYHACSIGTDNKAYCWGGNSIQGGIGSNTIMSSTTPIAVEQGQAPASNTWKKVVAGQQHSCGIASDDKVYCWGINTANSNLGNDSYLNYYTPTAIAPNEMPANYVAKDVATGSETSCVIDATYTSYCWGSSNDFGNLGIGRTGQAFSPQRMITPVDDGLQF